MVHYQLYVSQEAPRSAQSRLQRLTDAEVLGFDIDGVAEEFVRMYEVTPLEFDRAEVLVTKRQRLSDINNPLSPIRVTLNVRGAADNANWWALEPSHQQCEPTLRIDNDSVVFDHADPRTLQRETDHVLDNMEYRNKDIRREEPRLRDFMKQLIEQRIQLARRNDEERRTRLNLLKEAGVEVEEASGAPEASTRAEDSSDDPSVATPVVGVVPLIPDKATREAVIREISGLESRLHSILDAHASEMPEDAVTALDQDIIRPLRRLRELLSATPPDVATRKRWYSESVDIGTAMMHKAAWAGRMISAGKGLTYVPEMVERGWDVTSDVAISVAHFIAELVPEIPGT